MVVPLEQQVILINLQKVLYVQSKRYEHKENLNEYDDDANHHFILPLHLHLSIINQEDNQDVLKDKPKTNLLGFISNPFILFWSIYYTFYTNYQQRFKIIFKKNYSFKINNIMDKKEKSEIQKALEYAKEHNFNENQTQCLLLIIDFNPYF